MPTRGVYPQGPSPTFPGHCRRNGHDPPGTPLAPALLDLVSNVVYNARTNTTSPDTTPVVGANYATLPPESRVGVDTKRL